MIMKANVSKIGMRGHFIPIPVAVLGDSWKSATVHDAKILLRRVEEWYDSGVKISYEECTDELGDKKEYV